MTSAGLPDYLAQHIRRVDVVASIAEPPKAWTELRARWDEFTDFHARPIQEQLITAVLEGDGDISTLKALAAAETSSSRADVVLAVRGACYPRLIEIYSEVADTNYAKVSKEFNAVASEFTAAAKQCDPEADAETLIDQPDPVRTGWLDAQRFAARLDKLVPVLVAAVELAGVSARDDTCLLPLLVDPTGCHRRRLWEAWRSAGERCGRWSAVVGLGARVRAADLDGFAPYREPKALMHKQFPTRERGIYKPVVIDPEDEDYVPPPEEPKRRGVLAR
ncbi:MAG TPA: hypothetical protein VEF72_08825 [Mycobacterium sp.]|nr:hypothetical protein [Mycobacterium sp.]